MLGIGITSRVYLGCPPSWADTIIRVASRMDPPGARLRLLAGLAILRGKR